MKRTAPAAPAALEDLNLIIDCIFAICAEYVVDAGALSLHICAHLKRAADEAAAARDLVAAGAAGTAGARGGKRRKVTC